MAERLFAFRAAFAVKYAMLLLLASAALAATAQSPEPGQPAELGRVELEVRVADDRARPLLDLEAADFEVLAGDLPVPVAGLRGPDPSRRHLLAILVEARSLPKPRRTHLLSGLDDFLGRRLEAGHEVVMVLLGERVEVLTPPTRNLARLRGALQAMATAAGRSETLVEREESNRERHRASEALREMLRALAGSERPVIALYVTKERAAGPFSEPLSGGADRPAIALREAEDPNPTQNSRYIQYVISAPTLPPRLTAPVPDLEPLVRAANAGGVSIYPLRLPPSELALVASTGYDSSRGALTELAEGTGGQVLDSRRLGAELSLLEAHLDGAYTLILDRAPNGVSGGASVKSGRTSRASGGVPTSAGTLRVRVTRPATRSVHRPITEVASGQVRLENRALAALHLGISENPLEAEVEVFSEGREAVSEARQAREIAVQVVIPAEAVLLEERADGVRGELSLCLAVRGPRGGRSDFHHFRLPLELAKTELADGQAAFAWRTRLRLGSREHSLVVAVRDEGSGKVSAIWRKVDAAHDLE